MRRASAALAAGLLLAGVWAAPSFATDVPSTGCDVESATLEWGFKESFRAYIDGSIANGEWTAADGAGYETPLFSWSNGAGMLDAPSLAGDIAFTGSVRFTGHGGVLDTTVANPVIRFESAGRAILLLDVSGPTMAGDPFSATAVPFVDVDLSGVGVLTRQGDTVRIDAAPTVLTAEGSAAFPNYEAGTEFDPVTITVEVADECEIAVGDGLIGDATPFVMLVAAAVGLLLIAGVVILIVAIRRRR